MADLDKRVVQQSLTDKGFRSEEGTRHQLWWYYRGNPPKKTRVRIAFSRGKQSKSIGNDIVRLMKMELGLDSMKDARAFLVCEMAVPVYERLVGPKYDWDNIPKPEPPQP